MTQNLMSCDEALKTAVGHICVGIKRNGKRFSARLASIDQDYLIFVTQSGHAIFNHRSLIESLVILQ